MLTPLVLLICSCKRKEFARDTIISGIVIEENEKPIEGFGIRFMGEESGLSGRTKFRIEAYTDSLGKFRLSQRIPKGTYYTMLYLIGSEIRNIIYPGHPENHLMYYEIGGKYELIGATIEFSRDQWGKSIEFKFKAIKEDKF